MRPLFLLFAAVVAAVGLSEAVGAEINRRDREDPELVVDSGGRMGNCDQLIFTDDGKQLLAVGDDKVVRVWDFVNGKLQPAAVPVLRWSIWREQRGAIYALALSPDKDNERVAIGGLGAMNTTVSVLERTSGKVLHTVTPVIGDQNFYAVWSMAFAPSGKQVAFGTGDGSVFVWDFKKYRRVGKHEPKDGDKINTIRLVAFFGEDRLLSVAQDGSARVWGLDGDAVQSDVLDLFDGKNKFHRVVISPDKKWLAAATFSRFVEVRSLASKDMKVIKLGENEFPQSIMYDRKNPNRLAVGVGSMVKGSRFHVEADNELRFYDMKTAEPTMTKGPPHSFRAWFFAFHPIEDYLAVAGGDNHEVTLWNLDKPAQPASVMRGVGSCLWDVALSQDGKQFAFQDHRDPLSPDPNKRGKGAWRVFDPFKRDWREEADFVPVKQFSQLDGWAVAPDPNGEDPYLLFVVSPKGKRMQLQRFPDQESMPRCWTFIKGDDKKPVRLAVGHYWGLSLYELTENGAKRTRVFAGHQGEVNALAVSADRSWIISASNDQTIAAWNIDDVFTSQPILGAKFAVENDKLVVKAVDVGSPAWEAGLVVDDEVTHFRFAAEKEKGGPEDWLKRLEDPVPGLEHYFIVKRAGEKEPIKMLTTARHRPLWRFFPTNDGEWALWMWRNSFYDCSTKGDSYIGFHVNNADINRAPAFYHVEQFRKVLERPDVIDILLKTRDVRRALKEVAANPLPLSFVDRFGPPAVAMQLSDTTVVGNDVKATLLVTALSANPDFQPARAELWINDFRVQAWKNLGNWANKDNDYTLETPIPNAKLRVGVNLITFQVYNRLGGRWDVAARIECKRPPKGTRVFGLAIGVNDYSGAKVGPGVRGNLLNLASARNDAEKMQELWAAQNPKEGVKSPVLELLDKNAKRADILKALGDLADRVGPDDNCVLFFAGHGLFVDEPPAKGEAPHSTFVFCCPDFDLTKKVETGISSEVLFGKLAAIPGHKFVIVDACQSGEAAASPVRVLIPGGQGPIVMAACDRNQRSYEDPKLKHGIFTYAIMEALNEKFKQADMNGDKQLDAAEIYNYTRNRMPDLLKQIGLKEHEQVPVMSPGQEKIPLARLQEK